MGWAEFDTVIIGAGSAGATPAARPGAGWHRRALPPERMADRVRVGG